MSEKHPDYKRGRAHASQGMWWEENPSKEYQQGYDDKCREDGELTIAELKRFRRSSP